MNPCIWDGLFLRQKERVLCHWLSNGANYDEELLNLTTNNINFNESKTYFVPFLDRKIEVVYNIQTKNFWFRTKDILKALNIKQPAMQQIINSYKSDKNHVILFNDKKPLRPQLFINYNFFKNIIIIYLLYTSTSVPIQTLILLKRVICEAVISVPKFKTAKQFCKKTENEMIQEIRDVLQISRPISPEIIIVD